MKINTKILTSLKEATNSDFSKLENYFEFTEGDFDFIKDKDIKNFIELVYDWYINSKLESKENQEMVVESLETILEVKGIDKIIEKLKSLKK